MRNALPVVFAAVLLTPASAAVAADRSDVASMCQNRMLMSASDCACIADRAMKSLDATQRDYIVIPPLSFDKSSALAKTLTSAEIAGIDTFMREVPDACHAGR